jgi:hypothetical protein
LKETTIPPLPELYSVPPYAAGRTFFGRQAELQELNQWAQAPTARVMVVEAIGGMGKSALTWEWVLQHARQVAPLEGVFWWSFYEGGATMDGFITHALAYLSQQPLETVQALPYPQRVTRLLETLTHTPALLVMDGLERCLVAYHRLNPAHLQDDQVQDERQYRGCTDPRDAEFLVQLATTPHRAKILISTRLMPLALQDDFGLGLRSGVQQRNLHGLAPQDARDFLFQLGNLRYASTPVLQEFFERIGHHSLLIKVVAGLIKKQPQLDGDFDLWYEKQGLRLNLATLATTERRKHILFQAFAGLDARDKLLLGQIAAFSAPVNYKTVSIFNPYLPPRPPRPPLPAYPQLRSSPFGSPKLAWLRYQLGKAETPLAELQIQAQILMQESEDAQAEADREAQQAALQAEYARVKAERQRLLAEHDRAYQNSPAYMQAENYFQQHLNELEERGLLQFDSQHDIYDLHPVVRGYALDLLKGADRERTFEQIQDYFAKVPQVEQERVRDRRELNELLEAYRALVITDKLDFAANYYRQYLANALFRLGEYYLMIELLTPLFDHNSPDQHPALRDALTRVYITHDIALALSRTGQTERAAKLFSLNLDPSTETNPTDMAFSIASYADNLMHMNRLAEAVRGYELALAIIAPENAAWIYYDLFSYAVTCGQWEQAEEYYQQYQMAPQPIQAKRSHARFAGEVARRQVYLRQPAQRLLQAAETQLQSEALPLFLARLYEVWALDCLHRQDWANGEHYIKEALHLGNKIGEPSAVRHALLARLYLGQGKHDLAQRWLVTALADRHKTPDGYRADLYAHAAAVYLGLGERAAATETAQAAQNWAWAAGEPHARWYPLQQARQTLTALNLTIPALKPFETHEVEPLPYEAAIRTKFITQRADLLSSMQKPRQQAAFEFTRATWIQVGTLAVFGIFAADGDYDYDLIKQLAQKLTALSDLPTPLYFSRMGEEVPEPETFQIDEEHKTFGELVFTFQEFSVMDKFFLILYLESANTQGEKVYAYVNVRLDRLGNLLEKLEHGAAFNLSEYTTLIFVGKGTPPNDQRAKLRRDYLFGEHYLNVRIFPALKDVTGQPTPDTTEQAGKKQSVVEMTRLRARQLGTIATFGIEDTDLVMSMAYRLTRLSDQPRLPVPSRMGEDIPASATNHYHAQQTDWDELVFAAHERSLFDKFFIILYVESHNIAGELVYAYVNVRLDRLEQLLQTGKQGRGFNLADYATLIISGYGTPSAEVRTKLHQDYLFGEDRLNVRIFPPLNDLTQE